MRKHKHKFTRKPSTCKHLKGWKWQKLKDGSVKRTCKVRSCRLTIVEMAIGKGLTIAPLGGNYIKKRKNNLD